MGDIKIKFELSTNHMSQFFFVTFYTPLTIVLRVPLNKLGLSRGIFKFSNEV